MIWSADCLEAKNLFSVTYLLLKVVTLLPGLRIDPFIYNLQGAACVLIVLTAILATLLGSKKLVKYMFTVFAVLLVIVNYAIVSMLLVYEQVSIYPLFIVERYREVSSVWIDYGQLGAISILIVWRRELMTFLRSKLASHRASTTPPGRTESQANNSSP